MEAIQSYILISAICLSFCYLGFLILQRNETKLKHLRLYLLLSMLLAILLPFLKVQIQAPSFLTVKETIVNDQISSTPIVNHVNFEQGVVQSVSSSIRWSELLVGLYVVVASLLLLRMLFHLLVLVKLFVSSSKIRQGTVLLLVNPKIQSPFSFFKWIFISEEFIENEDVIQHEKVHASQYHSLDILLIELLTAVMWFNPFVWMMRKSVQLMHEYLADEGVLRTGIDRLQYQALLVNQVAEGNFICLSSGFHHSLIKKRLIMMTKNKPDRDPKLRILTFIPIALFLFVGVACLNGQNTADVKPAMNNEANVVSEKKEDVKPFHVLDGKHITKDAFTSIDPNDIESINITRDPLFEANKGQMVKFLKEKGLYETYIAGQYKAVVNIVLKEKKEIKKEKFSSWITERTYMGVILKERFFVVCMDKHLTKEQYLALEPSKINAIVLTGGVQTEQDKEKTLNYLKEKGLYDEFTAGNYAAVVHIVLKK